MEKTEALVMSSSRRLTEPDELVMVTFPEVVATPTGDDCDSVVGDRLTVACTVVPVNGMARLLTETPEYGSVNEILRVLDLVPAVAPANVPAL